MASATVKLGDKKIRLESSAYSLILYETTFNRRFLKDFDNICGNDGELDVVNYLRFIWVFAKNTDDNLEDFESFVKGLELKDIFKNIPTIVNLISESLGAKPKKRRAGIPYVFSFLARKFSLTRHGEG
ncbi:MAG: hypothetical protein VZQ55_06385 [Ruminococcus sp.]|nr:hypothetical protein [Ruminococcus sp.]